MEIMIHNGLRGSKPWDASDVVREALGKFLQEKQRERGRSQERKEKSLQRRVSKGRVECGSALAGLNDTETMEDVANAGP